MNDRFVQGAALPPSLGLCADLYAEVREIRLAMEKEVEKVQAREMELREHLIASLSKSDDTGVAGKTHRAQIVVKPEPKAEDWPAVQAFIQKSGRFDILQKRLAVTAVKDMWDAGEAVPGVGKVLVPSVSITKIPGR